MNCKPCREIEEEAAAALEQPICLIEITLSTAAVIAAQLCLALRHPANAGACKARSETENFVAILNDSMIRAGFPMLAAAAMLGAPGGEPQVTH